MENQIEIWKDLPGYEGLYQVSNLGKARSIRFNKEKILKPSRFSNGYFTVALSKEKNQKTYALHRLIAISFIENKKKLPVVNHIDGNKLNNNIFNLEWVSNRENIIHACKKRKKTSNYCGVSWDKRLKKWRAQIVFNNKTMNLGSFNCELAAYNERMNFEKKNGITNKYL